MSDQEAHDREYTFFDEDGPIRLSEHELANEFMALRAANAALTLERAELQVTVGEVRAEVARLRRTGFDEGLVWVRERFNLDSEDVDALNEALEKGPWE